MKLVIVYASAGSGHRRAAEALFESLDEGLKEQTLLVDILDHTPKPFKAFYSKGYTFLVSRLSFIWALSYRASDIRFLRPFVAALRRMVNFLACRRFCSFLLKVDPRIVISTHFMSNEVISSLKRKRVFTGRLLSVITDYSLHSFWINKQVEMFFVALDEIKQGLIRAGIKEERIIVSGIPVDSKFIALASREQAGREVGVSSEKFTALLLTGSLGLDVLYNIARCLSGLMQVLVIYGTNQKLKSKLFADKKPSVFLFPEVSNIHDFFACSDIIVTKGGGLTITECLVSQKPMFFAIRIPGQEARNVDTLLSLGCAVFEPNIKKLCEKIEDFKNNPAVLNNMRKSIASVSKPQATEIICRQIGKYAD